MQHHRTRLATVLVAGTFTLPACGDAERAPAQLTEAEAEALPPEVDPAELPDDIYIAGEADDSPPPVIYYDLTRHDWYARGEPLLHEGWSYVPGALVSARGADMEAIGEYGGVAYYRRRDGGADTLFVPVFERYWLAFNPDATAERVDSAADEAR